MEINYKTDLQLVYQNKDWEGNEIKVWRGKSLKQYPSYIANADAVFYIETKGLYRFTLKDQYELMKLVLAIVVIPQRRAEKAQGFIDIAEQFKGGRR